MIRSSDVQGFLEERWKGHCHGLSDTFVLVRFKDGP